MEMFDPRQLKPEIFFDARSLVGQVADGGNVASWANLGSWGGSLSQASGHLCAMIVRTSSFSAAELNEIARWANEVAARLHGKAAGETWTIDLLDKQEKEAGCWCCWSLTDSEFEELTEELDKAGVEYETYKRKEYEPQKLLDSLGLHIKEIEGEL